jgi:cold shock CspA family protein
MGGPVPPAGPQWGRVTAFDPERGWGTVTADDGTGFEFHATAIADGSRDIDVGARVIFAPAPGSRGRYEARSIGPVPAPAG